VEDQRSKENGQSVTHPGREPKPDEDADEVLQRIRLEELQATQRVENRARDRQTSRKPAEGVMSR
jgi:hypothetical protein